MRRPDNMGSQYLLFVTVVMTLFFMCMWMVMGGSPYWQAEVLTAY